MSSSRFATVLVALAIVATSIAGVAGALRLDDAEAPPSPSTSTPTALPPHPAPPADSGRVTDAGDGADVGDAGDAGDAASGSVREGLTAPVPEPVGGATVPSVVAAAPSTAAPPAAEPSGAGVWAVIVGVDEYSQHGEDLRAGVADADQAVRLLSARGVPGDQVRVLLDGEATGPAARSALEWLVASAGPDATAVVFFSGHVREAQGDRDGDGEEIDEALLLPDGEVLLDGELARLLDGLRARHTWLAVAGCYAGGFDDALAPGRVLTGAAREGELAYENDRLGQSYLVEYMVRRAMLESETASVEQAFRQAVEEVQRDYPNRLPVIDDRVEGDVEIGGGRPGSAPARPAGPGDLHGGGRRAPSGESGI